MNSIISRTGLNERGFSLLELIITIAIGSILFSVGIPAYKGFVANRQVRTVSYNLVSTLLYARSEAIKRNSSVSVTATGGDWLNGWQILTATADVIREQDALRNSAGREHVSIVATDAAVVYQASGRLNAGAQPSFIICDTAGLAEVKKRVLTIELSGKPALTTDGDCAS